MRRLLLQALAVCLALSAWPAAAQAGDADAGLDASVALAPAPPAPDVVPEVDRSAADAQLTREIDALRRLVAGEPMGDVAPSTLFEVKLTDSAAVAQRVAALTRQVEALSARSQPEPLGDGGVPSDAGVASDADAGVAGVEVAFVNPLLLERTRLRLAFLSLSPARRAELLAEAQRRSVLYQQQSDARREQMAAEAEEKAAEADRLQALEEAQQASTASEEMAANERARMLAALEQLAGLKGQAAEDRQRLADAAATRLSQEKSYEARATAEALTPEDASALYDELVNEGAAARDRLRVSMSAVDEPSKLSVFETRFDPNKEPWKLMPDEARAELDGLLARVREGEKRYFEDERAGRLQTAQTDFIDTDALNAVRLALLKRLPSERRHELLGLSRGGLEQLAREVDQLSLTARWYPRRRLSEVRSLGEVVNDVVAVGLAGLTLVKLVLLFGAVWLARKRWRVMLQRLRGAVLRRLAGRPIAGAVDRWFRAFLALGGPIGILIFVLSLFAILPTDALAELTFIRALAAGYAWYALAIALAHYVLTSAVTLGRAELSAELSERILWSVRLAGRLVLGVVVLLIVSERVLGRGSLYQLVIDASWFGGAAVAFVLLRHWREDLSRVYMKEHPQGRLLSALKATAKSPFGLFVVVLAFVVVASQGIVVWLRETLLRFDQTRKALAFIFRRQMEKHAETVGRGVADISLLPENLLKSFTEGPADEGFRLDRFPTLDEVMEGIEEFKKGQPGRATALVGEQGIGKTSWLEELARRCAGLEVVGITLSHRYTTEAEVVTLFNEQLGFEATDLDGLIDAICAGPRRLLVMDHCQNLVLRTVGGLQAYEAFARIVAQAAGSMPMVCSFARYTWQYLEAVTQNRNIFRHVVELAPWREEDIASLIESRMKSVGVEASFEDLVVERLDGTAFDSEVIRTGARYVRLLWDYADGNPRVAVHFWLRSLVPDGDGRVRVRLFQAPSADQLESLGEQSRFVLTAIVTHENVNADELVRVLRYPKHQVESTLEYLRAQGFITENDHGRIRIATHWNRAVLRSLRRKHLLYGD